MMDEQRIRTVRAKLEYVGDVAERVADESGNDQAVVIISAMLATLDFVLEEGELPV